MPALLFVMLFVLTIGGLANSPTPAGSCCTSISNQTDDLWCQQVGCDPEYAGFCKWTPCSAAPSKTPTAEPSNEPTTAVPSSIPTTAPNIPTTMPPSFVRLTDGTARSAVLFRTGVLVTH